jgi:hypothetical protein
MCEMSWCHQSQISEWLPWVGRHKMETRQTLWEWENALRDRFARRNREMGIETDRAIEVLSVTAWGAIPTVEQLLRDFPGVDVKHSRIDALQRRLAQWAKGAG